MGKNSKTEKQIKIKYQQYLNDFIKKIENMIICFIIDDDTIIRYAY